MKQYLLFGAVFFLQINAFGQKRDLSKVSPISISPITAENIQKSDRLQINLTAAIPFGGNSADYFGTGVGISTRVHFGNRNTVYTASDIEKLSLQPSGNKSNDSRMITAQDMILLLPKYSIFDDTMSGFLQQPSGVLLYAIEKKSFNTYGEFGANFLSGKKFTMGEYEFESDPATIVYLNGGVSYSPCFRGEVSAQAGPAMIFFPNGNEFGFRVGFSGSFDFTKPANHLAKYWDEKAFKPNLGLFGGISYNNFSGVDGFFTGEIGLKMSF